METSPQQKYPKELSEPAAGLVCEQELTIPKAARGLSMSDEAVPGMDSHSTPVTDLDDEVFRLKRALAEARMECEILKQTLAHFAKAKLSERGL
ncbi:MAG: hypothetical protein HOP22_16780 [Nitrospiraceae bacterium]|nr:hypothetical protein [Nitrospiraceae bacterium]